MTGEPSSSGSCYRSRSRISNPIYRYNVAELAVKKYEPCSKVGDLLSIPNCYRAESFFDLRILVRRICWFPGLFNHWWPVMLNLCYGISWLPSLGTLGALFLYILINRLVNAKVTKVKLHTPPLMLPVSFNTTPRG